MGIRTFSLHWGHAWGALKMQRHAYELHGSRGAMQVVLYSLRGMHRRAAWQGGAWQPCMGFLKSLKVQRHAHEVLQSWKGTWKGMHDGRINRMHGISLTLHAGVTSAEFGLPSSHMYPHQSKGTPQSPILGATRQRAASSTGTCRRRSASALGCPALPVHL